MSAQSAQSETPRTDAIAAGLKAMVDRRHPDIVGTVAQVQATLLTHARELELELRALKERLQFPKLNPAPRDSQVERDAESWRILMALCGSFQDGSDTPVRLHQDDATRTCFALVGQVNYFQEGAGFSTAVREAAKQRGVATRF